MKDEGWIKIHRRITEHWIWKNSQYVHAWMTILMTVNYEPKRVLVHGEIIDCGRGQAILSLGNWTKLFGKNWTIQRTRTFFDLLKDDSMINTEGLQKTTRLTVCKYDDYQDNQQAENTQKTSTEQASNTQITTTKEGKNIRSKEVIEEEKKAALAATTQRKKDFRDLVDLYAGTHPAEMLEKFYTYWSELNKSKTKMRWETEKTWETPLRLKTWAGRDFNRNGQAKPQGRVGQILQPDEERKQALLAKFRNQEAQPAQ